MGAEYVTAVELDGDAICDLQSNLEEFEMENVGVVQGDVTNLPFR